MLSATLSLQLKQHVSIGRHRPQTTRNKHLKSVNITIQSLHRVSRMDQWILVNNAPTFLLNEKGEQFSLRESHNPYRADFDIKNSCLSTKNRYNWDNY